MRRYVIEQSNEHSICLHEANTQCSLQEELQRLNRNKERRHAREKQKGISTDAGMSPGRSNSPATPTATGAPKTGGTQRKCANCGQVGHIKTNKKYDHFISLSLFLLIQ